MYQINFANPIHVHFMGIGGVSMSGLAEILLEAGFTITGSDSKKSALTEHLEAKGVKVFYGQKAENIIEGIDLVVYTAAISKDNPELVEAVNKNIPLMTRADLLGQIMKNYKTSIAVSGTHGKTTTTSMISEILMGINADPTLSIGGTLKSIGGNVRIGKSDTFVTEACEYTNSFLSFFPTIGIILNIEEDHMDFFKDINDIRNSFHKFAKLLPANGHLIINSDIDNIQELTNDLDCQVITFGKSSSSDYSYTDVSFDELGRGTYTLLKNGNPSGTISLGVVGEHNVVNSLSVLALMDLLKVSLEESKKYLLRFTGTDRRFEYKGQFNGVTVLDDYAHHPTEIAATLNAAKNYPHKKLWVVFQPHTYTRTNAFLKDFAKALSIADAVILADIYAAREKNTIGISSLDLLHELEKYGKECHYFPSFDEIEKFLKKNCINEDLLITMGAGNVVEIGENLIK